MKKTELTEKVDSAKTLVRDAMQTMFDALNHGQQKQIVKDEAVKKLFDLYEVAYDE